MDLSNKTLWGDVSWKNTETIFLVTSALGQAFFKNSQLDVLLVSAWQ